MLTFMSTRLVGVIFDNFVFPFPFTISQIVSKLRCFASDVVPEKKIKGTPDLLDMRAVEN